MISNSKKSDCLFSVCNPDQNDLTVCQAYFDEYFGRVDDWAKLHSVSPESQYWKVNMSQGGGGSGLKVVAFVFRVAS